MSSLVVRWQTCLGCWERMRRTLSTCPWAASLTRLSGLNAAYCTPINSCIRPKKSPNGSAVYTAFTSQTSRRGVLRGEGGQGAPDLICLGSHFLPKRNFQWKLIANYVWPIEWYNHQWPWLRLLKVSFAVLNLCNTHNSGNRPIAHLIYSVCIHKLESARSLGFKFFCERWRTSQCYTWAPAGRSKRAFLEDWESGIYTVACKCHTWLTYTYKSQIFCDILYSNRHYNSMTWHQDSIEAQAYSSCQTIVILALEVCIDDDAQYKSTYTLL